MKNTRCSEGTKTALKKKWPERLSRASTKFPNASRRAKKFLRKDAFTRYGKKKTKSLTV